jgi:hypothetical protein
MIENFAAKRELVETTFIQLLKSAHPSPKPLWGKMSFQQMIEHMILSFKSANTDKLFKENTKSPSFPEEPLPLHFDTLADALHKLQLEITAFFEVYQQNPGIKIVNPVFGPLTETEALQLLWKHCTHHLNQFGLQPADNARSPS